MDSFFIASLQSIGLISVVLLSGASLRRRRLLLDRDLSTLCQVLVELFLPVYSFVSVSIAFNGIESIVKAWPILVAISVDLGVGYVVGVTFVAIVRRRLRVRLATGANIVSLFSLPNFLTMPLYFAINLSLPNRIFAGRSEEAQALPLFHFLIGQLFTFSILYQRLDNLGDEREVFIGGQEQVAAVAVTDEAAAVMTTTTTTTTAATATATDPLLANAQQLQPQQLQEAEEEAPNALQRKRSGGSAAASRRRRGAAAAQGTGSDDDDADATATSPITSTSAAASSSSSTESTYMHVQQTSAAPPFLLKRQFVRRRSIRVPLSISSAVPRDALRAYRARHGLPAASVEVAIGTHEIDTMLHPADSVAAALESPPEAAPSLLRDAVVMAASIELMAKRMSWKYRIWRIIRKYIKPPLVGLLLGMLVAIVPFLRSALICDAMSWFVNALTLLGNAALPISVLVLGAQLYSSASVSLKPHYGLLLCHFIFRFLLMPLLGAALGVLLRRVANVTDPLTLFMSMIHFASPPNLDCTVLATLTDNPQRMLLATTILYAYLIAFVVMPSWATFFLWIST